MSSITPNEWINLVLALMLGVSLFLNGRLTTAQHELTAELVRLAELASGK